MCVAVCLSVSLFVLCYYSLLRVCRACACACVFSLHMSVFCLFTFPLASVCLFICCFSLSLYLVLFVRVCLFMFVRECMCLSPYMCICVYVCTYMSITWDPIHLFLLLFYLHFFQSCLFILSLFLYPPFPASSSIFQTQQHFSLRLIVSSLFTSLLSRIISSIFLRPFLSPFLPPFLPYLIGV